MIYRFDFKKIVELDQSCSIRTLIHHYTSVRIQKCKGREMAQWVKLFSSEEAQNSPSISVPESRSRRVEGSQWTLKNTMEGKS